MHLTGTDELQADTDSMLPGFRALMNLPTLPGMVARSLTMRVKMVKPN